MLVAALVIASGCADPGSQQPPSASTTSLASADVRTAAPLDGQGLDDPESVVAIGYTVDASYPHDNRAWTQGLAYAGPDRLYEGTGDYANSSLREVALSTGDVLRKVALPSARYYGEGITTFGDSIIQLTWKAGVAFVYRATDFALTGQIRYPAPGALQPQQGWGITTAGNTLFVSDGTASIYVADGQRSLDEGVLAVERVIEVTRAGQRLDQLNELEFIDGQIYANVWQTDEIVRIDPASGRVTGVLDLSGLLEPTERLEANVLNGIAYDPVTEQLLVTGKYWPRIFALSLD